MDHGSSKEVESIMAEKKYRIEKDSVQETLMIPLVGRKVCSDHYPALFADPETERILDMMAYDMGDKLVKMVIVKVQF